ncbi:MAG: hypothetical protein CMN74_05755 [Sphingorhabdus sp.]|nr:hypothetical protein [Sphingorhabdus sp.]
MSDRLVLTGTLKRAPGGFLLVADDGARWQLELSRTPVDLVEKRVRAEGVPIDERVMQVSGLREDAE